MPLPQRVWRTSVNWLQANEIGMTFGFFFGAAALTFLAMLPRRRTANRYANALIGVVTGAPLGVCANCVAPIGRGLYASGMSTESVLAAMFSSPTLNVSFWPWPLHCFRFQCRPQAGNRRSPDYGDRSARGRATFRARAPSCARYPSLKNKPG